MSQLPLFARLFSLIGLHRGRHLAGMQSSSTARSGFCGFSPWATSFCTRYRWEPSDQQSCAIAASTCTAANNTAPHKGCPSSTQSKINNAFLNLVLGPMMGMQSIPQLGRGGVVGIGLGAAGATSGLGWHLGLAGSVSVGLLFDSHGNIGLAISPSGGRGEGAGWTAGGQFTTAPFANTIWDLGGPSGSVGGGGGAGLAGAVEVSSNGGGAVTETVGVGAGGFGMTFLGGRTIIVPLVCHCLEEVVRSMSDRVRG